MLFALFACSDDVSSMSNAPHAGICYIPMPGSTMTPVTRANLARTCINIVDLKIDDSRFVEMMSYIKNAAPSDFDEDAVRVRITMPDFTDLYVNKDGEINNAGAKARLKSDDLKSFIKILNRLDMDWKSRCERKLGTRGCELPGDVPN